MSHNEFRKKLQTLMEFSLRGGYGPNDDMPVHDLTHQKELEELDDENNDPVDQDPEQNNLILLKHHADDALEALNHSELDVATSSLHDILEIIGQMTEELPDELQGGVDQIEESGVYPGEVEPQENERFPVGSVDPTQSNVTSGETKPFGSDDDYVGRDDTKAEIASLLVTIGHILHKDRLVPNKFDVPLIMEYLNHAFKQSPEEMKNLYESHKKKSKE